MNKQELIKKIILKKEFSQLPEKDVELAFAKFDNKNYLDEEKIKLTRDLLRKVFSVFASSKLFNLKEKDCEWFLKKHISTKERVPYYDELYKKILKNEKSALTILDFGAGINGFSYNYFQKKFNYVAIESVGQLVNLMNFYFEKKKISGNAIHESLFEMNKIKKIISKTKGQKIIFLFKVIDSLEMVEKDYSKKLLNEIVPLVDKVIVSFATRSLVSKKFFKAKRYWFEKFVKEKFEILDNFELGGERYFVFRKR